ncbi:hypothetical protein C8Q75DRAFT_811306 [Abortiporus biennis]|nr:hypothetical protein C8Q75DRAFT_811306 [Abortiporus biennis]
MSSTATDPTEASPSSEDTPSTSVPTPLTTEDSTTETDTSGTTDSSQTPLPISSTPSSTASSTVTPVFPLHHPPTMLSPTASPTSASTPIPITSPSISKGSISTLQPPLLTPSTSSSSSISTAPNNPLNPMITGTSSVNETETQSGGSSAISATSTNGGGSPNLHTSGSKSFTHNKGAIAAISSIIVFIFLIITIILIKVALRRRRPENFDKVDEVEGEEEGEIPVNARSAKSIGYDTSDGEGDIAYRYHLYSSPSLKRRESDMSYGPCYNSQMGYYGVNNIQVSNGVGRANYQAEGGRGGKEAEGGIVGEFDPFSTADIHTQGHDDSTGAASTHDIDGAKSIGTDFVSPSPTTFDVNFIGPSTVQPTPSSPSSPPPPLSLDNSSLTLSSPFNYRSDSSSSNLLEDTPKLAGNGGPGKIREDVLLRAHPSLSSDIFRLLEAAGLDFKGLGQSSTSIVSSEAKSSIRDSTSTLHDMTSSSSSIGRNSSPVWGLGQKLEDDERGDGVRNSREVVSFLGT